MATSSTLQEPQAPFWKNEFNCLSAGWLVAPLGGDQQIGAMITENKLDLLVFFLDPLQSQPHDPDIKALLRIAAVWNIPFACNQSTAEFVISSPLMSKDHERLVPDYEQYLLTRPIE
ncbi:MAG: methylglyoxal synthase [Endozoicomonas sp.]|uniref:methylglyoxal synthase n=1 Tax=Endozoicomonas sp. TaxID=1892382 RepID=UPI003D9B2043